MPTPVITAVTISEITHDTAKVTWTTDIAADTLVDYGLTVGYGSQVKESGNVTAHEVVLTGLTAETLYHYKVTSVSGVDSASSADATFTTIATQEALHDRLRRLLGGGTTGPEVTEITDAQLDDCIKKALKEFSKWAAIETIESVTYSALLDQVYQLSADADGNYPLGLLSVRIYGSNQGIDVYDLRVWHRDHRGEKYTGWGSIEWDYTRDGKMTLDDDPETGSLISIKTRRPHRLNTDSYCSTLSPAETDIVLAGAEALARILWAGYGGTVSFGGGNESRENQRTAGEKGWKAFVATVQTGYFE